MQLAPGGGKAAFLGGGNEGPELIQRHPVQGHVSLHAMDYAYKEFVRKPVAFVGYGSVGGARAVEQLRLVTAELQMVSVRNAVHIGGCDFLGLFQQGKSFDDYPHLAQSAGPMLDELAWWTKTLKPAREN